MPILEIEEPLYTEEELAEMRNIKLDGAYIGAKLITPRMMDRFIYLKRPTAYFVMLILLFEYSRRKGQEWVFVPTWWRKRHSLSNSSVSRAIKELLQVGLVSNVDSREGKKIRVKLNLQ
jgi:hypothetical protein